MPLLSPPPLKMTTRQMVPAAQVAALGVTAWLADGAASASMVPAAASAKMVRIILPP